MPKPGKHNKHTWKNQHNEHDFRNNESTRRVQFKSNDRFNNKGNKNWRSVIQAHLQDENVDIGGASGSRGYNNRKNFGANSKGRNGGGRSNSPTSAFNAQGKRTLMEGWYRVMLRYGAKYEKNFIMKTLVDNVQPLTLWPILWETNGVRLSFYIDDRKVAEKLRDLDRKVQMPDGYRLLIDVNNCGLPNIEITPELKEKLKVTMAKRYNAMTKALDLSKFHCDPDLQMTFCAICKPTILSTIVEIICENIPEIEAINLSENKMFHTKPLNKLHDKTPNLKVIHLANNMLKSLSDLDPLIGLPVVDLLLNENPLCSKFQDKDLYISEVRKSFPKVMKLDGIDLPPPISFDLTEQTALPSPSQTFLCNPDAGLIVRQFLEQYFTIFDTNNRQPLLHAYHESAVFSLTMAYPYGQRDKNVNWLNWYATENRNLMRVTDPERRNKLLKQGQLSVVGFLQEMPETKHDIRGFNVDLVLYTPQLISLSVSGMFKEYNSGHKTPPLRSFFRTFVIIPAGEGLCIVNETLHITNATEAQAKVAFQTPVTPAAPPPTPVSSPVASAHIHNNNIASPSHIVLDDVTKQRMVQVMAEQSGMNIDWSAKCLGEVNWDFNRAIAIFTDLHKQGVIPAEAFVK